jgi:hypothetical protein
MTSVQLYLFCYISCSEVPCNKTMIASTYTYCILTYNLNNTVWFRKLWNGKIAEQFSNKTQSIQTGCVLFFVGVQCLFSAVPTLLKSEGAQGGTASNVIKQISFHLINKYTSPLSCHIQSLITQLLLLRTYPEPIINCSSPLVDRFKCHLYLLTA